MSATHGKMDAPDRVLSIQSHVCSGYVGNKAATFPLQLLGFDVDVINTVQFSNHSGYGRLKGTRTDAEQLQSIITGLDENGLLHPARLLSGYIPGPEALTVVSNLARRLRKSNPDLIYLLDPVMGDDNKLYVAPECVPIYKDMLDAATIITPNWYEVELLTGVKLDSPAALRQALHVLHITHGVPHVVVSSLLLTPSIQSFLPSRLRAQLEEESEGFEVESSFLADIQLCLCSSLISSPAIASRKAEVSVVHVGSVQRIKGYFSGVGDLFSALVLAHFDPAAAALPHALTPLAVATTRALTSVQAIITSTHEYVQTLPPSERPETDDELDALDGGDRRVKRMRARELRLVQGRDAIINAADKSSQMVEWADFWDWQ